MDSFLRRERRRLLEDLIDLQREEDFQRQYQSIIHSAKLLERTRSNSDDSEYEDYRHRRKEYCLVKLTYRNPNTRRRRHLDEIIIIQHNRTVFQGCLQNGDQLTFKSERYRNESKLKLKFYINDLLEDEMIACCEHGLINRKRHHHLFQIEKIVGSKPCYECEFDHDTSTPSSPTSHSPSRQNSFTKTKTPASLSRSSSVLSEDQSYEQKLTENKSNLSAPQTHNEKASSEGFPADINEFSDYHTPLRNQPVNRQQSYEDSTDSLPINRAPPIKRVYGPPQLSTMLSVTESLDIPAPNIRGQSVGNLFNSSTNTQQRQVNRSNSNNQNESNVSLRSTQLFHSLSSNVEVDQSTTTGLNNPSNLAIANDATQLLMTQLGIIRQQQVERPETSSESSPREKGNVENFILIYLNSSNPDESIITNLRHLVNFLKIFNDIDDCIAFINTISHEKIILILSKSFSESIIPRIEELQQIFTIYILSEDEDENYSPSKPTKIRGLYTSIDIVYEQIKDDINKVTRDLIIYINSSTNAITLEPIFIYFQSIIEYILDKTEIKDNLKELIDFSRQEYDGNVEELKIIDEFEQTYKKNQAISWFSRSCFISKMLNKALRMPEVEILYKLRSFIQDLYQQIEIESTSESITVYLGQSIQRNDLDELQKNSLDNNLVSFPQFLFASTDQLRAIQLAKQIPVLTEDAVPLIIRVDIPEDMKCVYKNSHEYSFDDDNDILLNMGFMGRIVKIEKENVNEDQMALVHLALVKCENQRNIQQILDVKRAEIKSFSSFVGLIKLMISMNQQTSAEQMVRHLFNNEILKTDSGLQGSLAAAFHVLASTRRDQEDYKRAVELFLLSLDAFIRILPPTAIELCSLYGNIATMYFRLEDYDKSQEFHQKALDIQIHSNTPDLYSISAYTNSIGIVYIKQAKYPEAIKSFERTIKILEQISEPHDNELSLTYDNIGDAYLAQGKFEEALHNYSHALEIQERLEPRKVQTLGTSYHTIGNIYLKLGRSKEALAHFKRALECQQEYLPATHPSFALLYNNIGLMYYKEEDYSEALKNYAKSLEIAAIALPEDHSIVGITLFNIGLVYSSQDKFDEAIESIEKSTTQFLKTLPPTHPDVVENRTYIESIRRKKVLKNIFDENTATF